MKSFNTFSSEPCEQRSTLEVVKDLPHGSRIGFWPSYIYGYEGGYYLWPEAPILSNNYLERHKELPTLSVPNQGEISIIRGILFKEGDDLGIVVDTTFSSGETNPLVVESIMHVDTQPEGDSIPIKFCNDNAQFERLLAAFNSKAQNISNGHVSTNGQPVGFAPTHNTIIKS